jgi:tetratricopeptide (TPR) repeat protein
MRAVPICGVLLFACLLPGCDLSGSEALDEAAQAVAEAADPAEAELAPEPSPEHLKARMQAAQMECAVQEPNWERLNEQIAQRDFAALDAAGEEVRVAYAGAPRCERYVWELYGLLIDNTDLPGAEAWVQARPGSWMAHSLRAEKLVALGYERRGTRFAKDVTQEQWQGMRDAFARADRDIARALELEPGALPPYATAFWRYQASGGAKEIERALAALLERDPMTYGLRRRAIDRLTPRWGGSFAAMRKVADEAQAHVDANPRLYLLYGYAEWRIGDEYFSSRKYAEAAARYRKALEYGDIEDWYDSLANALHYQDDWKGVLETADRALATVGESGRMRLWRARALFDLGRTQESLADFDKTIELAPRWSWGLRHRAYARRQLGLVSGAIADLHASFETEKSDWALLSLAELAEADPKAAEKSAEIARRVIDAEPKNRAAWFLLGSALAANQSPDAKAAMQRYVELAQGDGEESTRLAQARSVIEPKRAGGLPAQAYHGLAPPAAPAP